MASFLIVYASAHGHTGRIALRVAAELRAAGHVVVLDDHVPPENYWPCFQAIAGRFDPS